MGIIDWLTEQAYEENEALKPFAGVYRGFSPTDESAIMIGELEVTISTRLLKTRWATGLRIEEGQVAASKLKMMSEEELSDLFQEGSSMADQTVAFTANGVQYIFPLADEIGLIIQGTIADCLGSTQLFNPEQVRQGKYDQFVDRVEKHCGPDKFPQLKYAGLVQR